MPLPEGVHKVFPRGAPITIGVRTEAPDAKAGAFGCQMRMPIRSHSRARLKCCGKPQSQCRTMARWRISPGDIATAKTSSRYQS